MLRLKYHWHDGKQKSHGPCFTNRWLLFGSPCSQATSLSLAAAAAGWPGTATAITGQLASARVAGLRLNLKTKEKAFHSYRVVNTSGLESLHVKGDSDGPALDPSLSRIKLPAICEQRAAGAFAEARRQAGRPWCRARLHLNIQVQIILAIVCLPAAG